MMTRYQTNDMTLFTFCFYKLWFFRSILSYFRKFKVFAHLFSQIHKIKKKFNHTQAQEAKVCVEKDLKEKQDKLVAHRLRAKNSRLGYYARRAKAVKPENVAKGYLSIIIDGAGAQASNYAPRYSTSEKGEPARHNALKIKSTYVKVSQI